MKILFVSNSAWNLFNFRAPLIKALIKEGIQLSCLCKFDDFELKLKQMGCAEVINLKSIVARGKNPWTDLKLMIEIRRVFKTIQADLIFLYTPKINIYGGILAAIVGRVYINNITGLGSEFKIESGFPYYLKMLYRTAMKKAGFVVSHNSEDLKYLIEQKIVNKSRSVVIPGSGIDMEYFQSNKKLNGVRRFLFMGRFLKEKGIVEFIEAAQILVLKYPEIKFRIVGNNYGVHDDNIENLLKATSEHSSFEFKEFTDDPRKEYEESDCFVLPSYREGMSKSLLEAMAMGRIVIASKVAGCEEAIQDGRNGFLTKVQDSESLLVQMTMAIELHSIAVEQMGNKARETIQAFYSDHIIVEQYFNIIESLKIKHSIH